MKTVKLKRFNDSGTDTLGAVFINGKPFCLSIEQEWNDNVVGNSCIPTGEYMCEWHNSHTYGWCYIVKDVPGRTHILFHEGNRSINTKGCILLGLELGWFGGKNAVLHSIKAVNKFERELGKKSFKLIVEN